MRKIEPSNQLEKKLSEFTEEQRKLIFENTGAVQLTKGCSLACPDCGVAALKGIKDFIPYGTLDSMFSKYGKELSKSNEMLYYASEPFDYKDGDKSYIDVHNMYSEKVGNKLSLITSVPIKKEEEILKMLKDEVGTPFEDRKISAMSLTDYNYRRVERKLKESGLMDDLEGVDSLKEFGEFVNQNSVGNQPVRDFVNVYKRYNLSDASDEKLADESIGCFHGVLMDPSGVYNLRITNPTKENPTGEILEEITPENFKVMPHFKNSQFVSNDLFLAEGEEEFLTL